MISRPVKGFSKLSILAKLLLDKKCPKLGIQLPNYGEDNQSYHTSMIILNQNTWLRVMYYSFCSGTLFYTNVLIFTWRWGGVQLSSIGISK